MHIISGLKKRLAPAIIGATAAEAPAMPAAKRPTAKEMREEEIRVGMEQTRKNLAEAPPASSGGSTSDTGARMVFL